MLSRAHLLLFRTLIRPWLLLVYKTNSTLADTNKSKLALYHKDYFWSCDG